MRRLYAFVMRTTIQLDDHLFAEVKQLAARSGRTFASVTEDALRELLARRTPPPSPGRAVHLTTVGGDGPLPGVDLDDAAGLADLMEEGDAPG